MFISGLELKNIILYGVRDTYSDLVIVDAPHDIIHTKSNDVRKAVFKNKKE